MSQAHSSEGEHAPLNTVLLALGEEFRALGQFTEQFQESLAPALLRVASDPACHRDVQTLDLLSQRLVALSRYVLTIGESLPEDWQINSSAALRSIFLSDLVYRLRGAPIPEQPEKQSGSLELF